MDQSARDTANTLLRLRNHNAAWLLLASRRAPVVIACLKSLFEVGDGHIPVEQVEQSLAEMLAEHANYEDISADADFLLMARRELRDWIKRRLVVERDNLLIATDELRQALAFIDGIQERIMTSTASRLATVQREIEGLAIRLSADADSRRERVKSQMASLQAELDRIDAGQFEVLKGQGAAEGIREVFDLAMSLRADFRRVEDSYRAADRELRQSIITEQHHRGEIVDKLLDTHDALLETPEGQVFAGFHAQLVRAVDLEKMKVQLREIARNEATEGALTRQQRVDLTWLTMRLVSESKGVIKARAYSERDVKAFIKTGLAVEHHRVGQLLNEVLEAALDIDWGHQAIQRSPSPLPCIAVDAGNLPLVERLRFKAIDTGAPEALLLGTRNTRLEEIEDDFWDTFDTLDRQALFDQTREMLLRAGVPMSIGELSQHLTPTHDLETIAFWLSLARQAGASIEDIEESFEIATSDGEKLRFHVPRVLLSGGALETTNWEF